MNKIFGVRKMFFKCRFKPIKPQKKPLVKNLYIKDFYYLCADNPVLQNFVNETKGKTDD